MRISLRTKAVLLMLITLACTAGPLMNMSLRHSRESVQGNYEMAMTDILNLAEYAIKNNFDELLHIKTIAIESEKNVLEANTRSAVRLLQALRATGWSQERCATALLNLTDETEQESQLVVVGQYGTPWSGNPTGLYASLIENEERKQHLLSTIEHLVNNEDEEFIVYTSTGSPILAYIAPLPKENAVMLALISLTPSIQFIENTLNTLRSNLAEVLSTLHTLGDSGGVYPLTTNPLRPFKVDASPFSAEALASIDEALSNNRQKLTVPSPKGPLLCWLKVLPLHHNVVVAAVPEEEFNKSMNALAMQQGLFFAVVLLVGGLLAVLFSSHLLSPLARFSSMAKRLPLQDFTAEGPSETATLPVQRHDEIGELARSFVDMENILRDTVRRLIHTATAKERLEGELNVAREIQEGILPKIFPPLPPLQEDPLRPGALPTAAQPAPLGLFASLVPAREMGGDLYDFFFVDNDTMCVAVGDVSGKGVPAALFMSITVTLLRTTMRAGVSPELGMERLNTALATNNPQDMFVSLFLGLYNIHTGELRYAVGGHPLPIRLASSGCVPLLCAEPDLVLGLFPNLPYKGHTTNLRPGEALFLYTDGVSEAMNESDEFYGEPRLLRVLSTCVGLSEKETLYAITADLARFASNAPQADDITMLMMGRPLSTSGEKS